MDERKRTAAEQASRNRKRAQLKKRRQRNLIIKITTFILILAGGIGGALLYKKYSPSKEMADLNEYYGIKQENQLAVVIDDALAQTHGIVQDGTAYVEYSVVRDFLNERFYVDHNENLLLYTYVIFF